MSEEEDETGKRKVLEGALRYIGVHEDDIGCLVNKKFHLNKDLQFEEMVQPSGDLTDWFAVGDYSEYVGLSDGGLIKVYRLLAHTLMKEMQRPEMEISFSCWEDEDFLQELKEMDEVNAPNEFVLSFLDLVDCSPLHAIYMNLYLGVHDHLTLYTLLEKGLQHGSMDFVPHQKVMATLLEKHLPRPGSCPKIPRGYDPKGDEVSKLSTFVVKYTMPRHLEFFLDSLGAEADAIEMLEAEYGVYDYSSLYALLPALRKGLLRERNGLLEKELQLKIASKLFLMKPPSELSGEDPLVDYKRLKSMEWSMESTETEAEN